jgi:predicted RecB family nuclease
MSKNLTLLEGINAPLAVIIKRIGIATIEQLANSSPQEIEKRVSYSLKTIEGWIAKAVKYLEGIDTAKIPPNRKLTSKYSMKSTTQRDIEENKESQNDSIP